MAPKWYVVTVGKDIGVFSNWVETGPLVKGVSGAVHQSFRSEEEARRVFSQAFSKGDTRIVREHCNANQLPHTSAQSIPTFSSGSNSYPNGSLATMSSIPSNRTLSTSLSPCQHKPQTISANKSSNSNKSFRPGSSSSLRPVSYILSESAQHSSHSTTVDLPSNNNKKPTEIIQVKTPQSNPTALSSSLKPPSRRPRAIVKTPSWLASYPKSPQPLSPLDNEYLSLNNFRTDAPNGNSREMDFKPSPSTDSGSSSISSMYCICTPRMSTISPQNGSVSDSSILFSPPVHRMHVVHEQEKDPRSPILCGRTKVPASGLNYISFARPSPSLRRDQLPAGLHEYEAPTSSLLFHSSRSAVQKEDYY